MSSPHFFASPEFDVTTCNEIAILLLVGFVPIFAVVALHGLCVLLGIFQIILLLSAELIQWQLTRRATLLVRVMSSICTYFVVNISLTLAVFCLWGR
jgi:hypothetical protein